MSRILLAIGFTASNAVSARGTIRQFGNYFRDNTHSRFEVVLGVEAPQEQRVELARFAHVFPAVYGWDDGATARALSALRGRPQPFSSGFSYGGYVNRVMILSSLVGCDYLLRIDPGTLPPVDLWRMIETQAAALQASRIVSGVYQDRLAFRDNLYARRSLRDGYLAFIAQETGVDLHCQITGGALFMVASPGIPAIPFQEWSPGEPTLVWGSDDSIFQDSAIKSHVFTQHKVPRHDPFGKAKPPVEYFRGVVGMAYLNRLRRNDDVARASVGSFVNVLNGFLDASLEENRGSRIPLEAQDVAPAQFLDRIDSGYANYLRLLEAWNDVVDDVKRAVPADTLALRRG
jgi:hypothetical protein